MLCTQSQPPMTGELFCYGKPHDAIVSLQPNRPDKPNALSQLSLALHGDHLLCRASGPEPKTEGKLL